MFRDILVGLDSSEASGWALTEAVELAGRSDGRLTILTAIPSVRGWAGGPIESQAAVEMLTRELVLEARALHDCAAARVPAWIPLVTVVRHKHPRVALLQELRSGRHDTLVIGSDADRRGRSGRSLSRQLLARSPVPIMRVGVETPARLHLPKARRWSAPWRDALAVPAGGQSAVAPRRSST